MVPSGAQFFFAADRENEMVRKRYDILNTSYMRFLSHIVERCDENNTKLSYCGEDAGKPLEAMALSAIGLNSLSMRAASIGPVKHLLMRTHLGELETFIEGICHSQHGSIRSDLTGYFAQNGTIV